MRPRSVRRSGRWHDLCPCMLLGQKSGLRYLRALYARVARRLLHCMGGEGALRRPAPHVARWCLRSNLQVCEKDGHASHASRFRGRRSTGAREERNTLRLQPTVQLLLFLVSLTAISARYPASLSRQGRMCELLWMSISPITALFLSRIGYFSPGRGVLLEASGQLERRSTVPILASNCEASSETLAVDNSHAHWIWRHLLGPGMGTTLRPTRICTCH